MNIRDKIPAQAELERGTLGNCVRESFTLFNRP
jgi:hypothetical protein